MFEFWFCLRLHASAEAPQCRSSSSAAAGPCRVEQDQVWSAAKRRLGVSLASVCSTLDGGGWDRAALENSPQSQISA